MNSDKFSDNIYKAIGNRFSMGILGAIVISAILVWFLPIDNSLKTSLLIALGISLILAIYSSYVWVTENENHIRTLPQTWTTSGLLGTFGTLTYNFYNIGNSEGIATLDINNIIHGLSLAFITSIFGILGSQVMNILINIKYDNKDKDYNIIETPEKMLMDLRNNTQDKSGVLINSLRNIEDLLSESQKSLSSLETNFINMKKDITGMFSGAMQNFNTSMQGDISKINNDIKEHVITLQKNFEEISRESVDEYKNKNIEIEKEMRTNLNTILSTQKDEFLKIQTDFKTQMNNFLIEVKKGNKEALEQQKDEANKRSTDIKEISDTIVASGNHTKESLEKIISEINIKVSASIEAIKVVNNDLLEQQKEEFNIRSMDMNKINTSILESSTNAEEAFNTITKNMSNKTLELSKDLSKEFELLLNSIKEHASTSEIAIDASSSRLVNAAKYYDKSVYTQNDLIESSESILNQLKLLISQREDEFKKYEWFEKQLTEQLQLT